MERAELRTWVRDDEGVEVGERCVFLCDSNWTASERADFERLTTRAKVAENETGDGWLCVRTGGSGGGMKFARHDEKTLATAVRGFCAHFGLSRVNAVGVLPRHHMSGLMAALRCAMTGGEYLAADWKRIEAGEPPALPAGDWVLSLVPTQLQRLLRSTAAVGWLRGFRIIFVGGGPVWPALAEQASQAKLRVSLGYGLTETAAMVTALQPEEFLAGLRSSGASMPHAQVKVAADGVVTVAGESLFRGYWPEWRAERAFMTDDLGAIDERGHLHILGRRDDVIITGGKKVQPAEVEAALRASGEFADVVVIGVPDPEWGEAVVACYPMDRSRAPDVKRAVEGLAAHQRPRRFVAIAEWPRNVQGKIDRAALRAEIDKTASH